jgi:hypothetical protein
MEHYISSIILWGCLPNNEGKNRDPRGGVEVKRSRMWGFPHSNEPEQCYEGELWAGVTPNGWRPMIWAPMKGALRPMKPRERAVNIFTNRYGARTSY